MEKGSPIVYVDGFGREHQALVTAINGLHPEYASIVYVDLDAPEAENVKKLFDVVHISARPSGETNPALPDYHVHVLKEVGDDHSAPPADHPQNDHPFHPVERDQEGIPIPVNRPEYMADVQAHQDAQKPSAADLDVIATDQKIAEITGGVPSIADFEIQYGTKQQPAAPSAMDKLKALAANFHKEPDVAIFGGKLKKAPRIS